MRTRVTATGTLVPRPVQFALVGILGLVVNSLVLYLPTLRLSIYYLASAVLDRTLDAVSGSAGRKAIDGLPAPPVLDPAFPTPSGHLQRAPR